MNLLKIVWKNLKKRKLATFLTIVSIALGVTMVISIITMTGEVEKNFNQSSIGYEVVVGAIGSPLQLVLSTIYFIDVPTGNMPYAYYEEIKSNPDVEMAVPIGMGDSYNGFRIVATTKEIFDFAYMPGKTLHLKEGKFFEDTFDAVVGSEAARINDLQLGSTFVGAHGLVKSETAHVHEQFPYTVVGILEETGTPNDKVIFTPLESIWIVHSHKHHEGEGNLDEEEEHHEEALSDTSGNTNVVTGAVDAGDIAGASPEDNTAHQPLHHEEHPGEEGEHAHTGEIHNHVHEGQDKEVTAVYVKLLSPGYAFQFQRKIHDERIAQAVFPVQEIRKLFAIVGDFDKLLTIVACLIVIVAGIGMLVSIYNSMNERKHDIAVMRALGARRGVIMNIILSEASMLAGIGCLVGIILGHIVVFVAGPYIREYTGVSISPLSFYVYEFIVFVGTVILGAVVGIVPAIKAYQTDVSKNLAP